MKEYLLELKIKNNYLFEQMNRCGFKNAAKLAAAAGVSPTSVGHMMNMKETPYNDRGVVRPHVDKVLDVLGCGVEDIYPPEQIEKALETNIYKGRVEAEELRVMLSSEISISGVIEQSEAVDALNTAIDSSLSPRYAKALRLRYMEEMTISEVGKELGVGTERARQILTKGMRTLRTPNGDDRKKLHEAAGVL